MKIIIFTAAAILFLSKLPAQTASDYFPARIGTVWNYRVSILDSLQQPIDSTQVHGKDSLTAVLPFEGKTASVLISKQSVIPETTFIALDGQSISNYMRFLNYPGVPVSLLPLFIQNSTGWYPYMKFGTSAVNNIPYTLWQFDTTITVDSVTSLPLRFLVTGVRRAVKSLSVPAGIFSATPFEISISANLMMGTFPIPFLKLSDTVYVAANRWIVKEIRQTTSFPLIPIPIPNLPTVKIPGMQKELEGYLSDLQTEKSQIPAEMMLEQNYPNPFNPSTTIRFTVPERMTRIRLIVYNLLGFEVQTLINARLPGGEYHVEFDAGRLASGIYFYTLFEGESSMTKRMLLLK